MPRVASPCRLRRDLSSSGSRHTDLVGCRIAETWLWSHSEHLGLQPRLVLPDSAKPRGRADITQRLRLDIGAGSVGRDNPSSPDVQSDMSRLGSRAGVVENQVPRREPTSRHRRGGVVLGHRVVSQSHSRGGVGVAHQSRAVIAGGAGGAVDIRLADLRQGYARGRGCGTVRRPSR